MLCCILQVANLCVCNILPDLSPIKVHMIKGNCPRVVVGAADTELLFQGLNLANPVGNDQGKPI